MNLYNSNFEYLGREIIALGEFQDGEVVCLSMGTLIKVKCPWELQISTIAQPQFKRDDTIDENMVSLIIFIIFIVNRNFNLNHDKIFYFKKILKN